MNKKKNIAFLFPGQGAQYVGMGKEIVKNFPFTRFFFEEADDFFGRSLSRLIFEGPEKELTETKNSQPAIFILGVTLLEVLSRTSELKPDFCAGLSLGEYTALYAANYLSFTEALKLILHRSNFMNEACEKTPGTMAAVLGMEAEEVERIIRSLQPLEKVWVANFNCPGQIVISGSIEGVRKGEEALKAQGAKRIVPLQVHGAFHSGLMEEAREKLSPYIEEAHFYLGSCPVVMNVSAECVTNPQVIRQSLIDQVTHSVRWEQSVRRINQENVELFIEFGPGKTLSGLNRKIGLRAPVVTLDSLEEVNQFLSTSCS